MEKSIRTRTVTLVSPEDEMRELDRLVTRAKQGGGSVKAFIETLKDELERVGKRWRVISMDDNSPHLRSRNLVTRVRTSDPDTTLVIYRCLDRGHDEVIHIEICHYVETADGTCCLMA